MIYILTRPLGASLGDLLSQPSSHGGLGLGVTVTSFIFLGAIAVIVTYLSYKKTDQVTQVVIQERAMSETRKFRTKFQVIATAFVVIVFSCGGYFYQHLTLQRQVASRTHTLNASSTSPLGDLSIFRDITSALRISVQANELVAARTHANDLEYAWDAADANLKPIDPKSWSVIDKKIDTVLRRVRAVNFNQHDAGAAVDDLVLSLQ